MNVLDLLFDQFNWFDYLFRIGAMIEGLFLLLLAGLAFTRLFRQPRHARLFLAAIGFSLAATWGVDRAFQLAMMVFSSLVGFNSNEWAYFAMSLVTTVVGLLLAAAMWWCLVAAVFDDGEAPPELDDATGEYA